MPHSSWLPSALPPSRRSLDAARILALFAAACRIRAQLRADAQHAPLRGRNLALLLEDPARNECAALERAAGELGARVAHVRYRHRPGAPHADVAPLARTLGRMYDAIDCGTLPAATVREMEAAANVPVYDGLGLASHPLRALGDLMTLYQHPLPPATPPTIRFHGDPASPQARAFVSAARTIGFDVTTAANEAAFVVDGLGAARWPICTCAGAIDETRRADNHRSLIQAVLIESIGCA
ncbi:MAG: hypothetical protein ABWZ88_21150 [Variovorax sp.]